MTNLDDTLLRAAVSAWHTQALAALPAEEALRQSLTLSPAHLRRMETLRRRLRREGRRTRWKQAAATALGAAAMLALLFTTLLVSNPDLRAAAAEWFAPVISGGRNSWNVEIPDGGIKADDNQSFAPARIPEGYAMTYRSDIAGLHDLFYSDSAGGNLYFSYMPLGTKNSYFLGGRDKDKELELTVHEGIEYYLLRSETPGKPSFLFWTDQRFMFKLSGVLDAETLLEIAYSVE